MAAVLTYGKQGRRMQVKSWGELLKLPLFPLTEGQEQVSVSVCACVSGAMEGGGGGGGRGGGGEMVQNCSQ